MESNGYILEARPRVPNFEAERKYLAMETKRAERERRRLGKTWMPFSYRALGLFRRKDWTKYLKELAEYSDNLAKHQKEIAGGLVPFEIDVVNRSGHDDRNIHVSVKVVSGSLDDKKKAPNRPERLDAEGGGEPKPKWAWPLGGFVRRHVRVGQHSIAVELSRLYAGDHALLVKKVLYLHYTDETRMEFEIRSKQVHQRGEVSL